MIGKSMNRRLRFEACEARDLLAVDLVADVAVAPKNIELSFYNSYGNNAVFAAYDRERAQVFNTNGFAEDTRLIKETTGPPLLGFERGLHHQLQMEAAAEEFETPIGTFFAGNRVESLADGSEITHHGLWLNDGNESPREVLVSGTETRSADGSFSVNGRVPFLMKESLFVGGRLFTLELTDRRFTNSRLLIVSDGTPEGTKEFPFNAASIAKELTSVGDDVYFMEITNTSSKLWKMPASRNDLEEIWNGEGLTNQLTPSGERLFFKGSQNLHVLAADGNVTQLTSIPCPATSCSYVHITGATPDGVLVRVNFRPHFSDGVSELIPESFRPANDVGVIGDKAYFAEGNEIFSYFPGKSDDPEPIFQASETTIEKVQQFGSDVYFNADGQLWVIRDDAPVSLSEVTLIEGRTANGSHVVFSGRTTDGDVSLWRSDGTRAGTVAFLDPAPGTADAQLPESPLYSNSLHVINKTRAYAAFEDGVFEYDLDSGDFQRILERPTVRSSSGEQPANNYDLQVTSAAGKDFLYVEADAGRTRQLWAREVGSDPQLLWTSEANSSIRVPEFTFYELEDGIVFTLGSGNLESIWKSDGTWNGTRIIADRSDRWTRDFTILDPYVAFADPFEDISILYHTQTGERVVRDGDNSLFARLGDRSFVFEGNQMVDITNPIEPVAVADLPRPAIKVWPIEQGLAVLDIHRGLWRTDGTEAGSFLIGPNGFDITGDPIQQGEDYLAWHFGASTNTYELYRIDVDKPATFKLIARFERSQRKSELPPVVISGEKVFVLQGRKLWLANLEGGEVSEIETGRELTEIELHESVSGQLIFSADFQGSRNLWSTDGTSTKPLTNGAEGIAGFTGEWTMHEGRLFFAGADELGAELWSTDGTTEGTRREEDIFSGATGSNPSDFVSVESELFFFADDGIHGRELFKFRRDNLVRSDLDGDGRIGFGDFLLLADNFEKDDASPTDGDINGDGEVSFEDFLIMSAEFGKLA